ncbi:nucleoside triphosphate pyrophosphohydrolase family protein [Photobacterium lucens]|uniref:nucleoside triphosphate pyrophosphohydrolase family protein n=1 Tax=Photobacterium lucens TaxID=2562949 RepID=UPI0006B49DC9|nr:nucleoside triphosphate pyrophosphohydrolase family protein [Photobacterium lucens]KPA51585.1 SAM-dependent methyltransferase [Photobacterium leiognathi subsp. mandapamensis]MBP2701166.1 nucleoside triphosphate pyrophosphohydrolase family protein [Vibrio parahaemolyticus]MZG57938.1 SAM-dependent methyltransferase [Photobacterium lucens]MZG79723.1 SAM-dependent methyltransferase [Photobacterium lucens]PSV21867.1 SAM-dependent methyltransferase [Photobacterium leiognathi subsp. mandapamensis]
MKLSALDQPLFDHLYRDIREFRSTFDLDIESPQTLDEQADALHTSLAVEEMTELAEADSLVEQADAIVDSVYVLMGRLVHLGDKKVEDNIGISYLIDILLQMSARLGIDFMACWNEVHSSNMSKVCRNADEYADTEAFYAKQGVTLTASTKGDYIIAKCAQDVDLEGKVIRKGKVLKSVYYRPADLVKLVIR